MLLIIILKIIISIIITILSISICTNACQLFFSVHFTFSSFVIIFSFFSSPLLFFFFNFSWSSAYMLLPSISVFLPLLAICLLSVFSHLSSSLSLLFLSFSLRSPLPSSNEESQTSLGGKSKSGSKQPERREGKYDVENSAAF